MHNVKSPLLVSLTPLTRIIFSILLIIVCFTIVFSVSILVAIPVFGMGLTEIMGGLTDFSDPHIMNLIRYLQVVQAFALFIIPALVAGFLFERNLSRFFGIGKPSQPLAYLLVFVLMFAAMPFVSWMITLNEMLSLPDWMQSLEEWMRTTEEEAARLTEAFIQMDSFGLFLFNFVMIALLPAVGEELLFRGLFQRLLRDWLGNVHVAIFISALFFSAMHMQFFGFVPRMMLGIFFGYLFYWSGSLWLPIWAHLLNNGTVVILAYLFQCGLIGGDYETFGTSENFLVIMISVVTTAFLLFLIRKRLQNH